MKSLTRYLTMNVPARMDFVNITPDVERAVAESGVKEGLCLVNAMHITASVFINDDETGLHRDYKKWLEELAPFDASPARYHHNRTGEDNADAHHKRQVMGREVVIAITDGKPARLPREAWAPMRMEDQFDAVLYLGPSSTMTFQRLSREKCADAGYMAMRTQRMALLPGGQGQIDRLKAICGI